MNAPWNLNPLFIFEAPPTICTVSPCTSKSPCGTTSKLRKQFVGLPCEITGFVSAAMGSLEEQPHPVEHARVPCVRVVVRDVLVIKVNAERQL